ncbi:protein DpdE [Shinella zoogloeoides]|uniref:protein DpdE n=1 Tax=Shinella zoogloeoides TaxID=352475 RepID=UPI00299EAF57|nr:protein DpdE [Shinella zoogloeoides]WPE22638.1 RNA polymerase-associated protein RapA [Shinella zoogloeoides]
MFVRSNGGQYASLGIGKQIDRKGSLCAVEYFDSPTSELVVHQIEADLIERVTLAEQTRIYQFDEAAGSWEIGRLLDDHGDSQLVQFPNGKAKHLKAEALFVRWALPIEDPMLFLANRINESPRFSDGRSAFMRSQTRQRAASMGMSALLASAIELEAHQVEVVRRILQDPVQRYLLADEVGLGKTIEAGVLIRQCIIDTQQKCSILVIVPAALVDQWRRELANKFFLGRCLDHSLHIVALDDYESIRALLPSATMLVIDEAHHLTGQKTVIGDRIYADVAAASPSIDRVLLLSATPALHNERGFLEMLHLLDPATYQLDDEESFRRKVESRQALAEIVAGLTIENALYLDYTIDQLATLFPHDELLQEHAGDLRSVIDTMPDPDDPALVEAIGRLHTHLSEVYRLHRRILRHRRRSIGGLTPDRSGAKIIRYRSTDRAALTAALEDWRFDEAVELDAAGSEKLWSDRVVRTFWEVLDRASQYPSTGPGIIGFLASETAVIGDQERFASINRCLGRDGLFEDRVQALLEALAPLVRSRAQCVVFCSDPKTADALAQRIRDVLEITVDRHDPEDDVWTAFAAAADHPVLVCDRRAEEGLNLQGGNKVVVHYDLPLNPNRIEQRLGRVDRYGSGEAVRSLVLACEDDPLEVAWIGYLDTALRVFDRSVASLQYLIEQTVREIRPALFTDGAEVITDLTASGAGDQGFIEREIKSIDQQDALDALGAPPTDMIDELSEIDDDWQSLATDTAAWLDQTLQFGRADEARLLAGAGVAAPFRYVYSTSNPHTLISLPAFLAQCADALDLGFGSRGVRTIGTIPYTFRRRTALSRVERANGVGLLRYGDPLISGMTALTDADDRGRSFAMWRFVPDHIGDPLAEFYFRFDFILEADSAVAMRVLAAHDRDTSAARAAVRRRGDMALAPFYRSIWLDRELNPVHNEALLARLARPYSVKPDRSGALDLNLNSRRWQRLLELQLPELAYWRELCGKARSVAEDALRADPELIASLGQAEQRAARIDQGRLGQLRVRARAEGREGESAELAFEEKLAVGLRAGINVPRVRLDTIGAVFISASRSATDQISGGI